MSDADEAQISPLPLEMIWNNHSKGLVTFEKKNPRILPG